MKKILLAVMALVCFATLTYAQQDVNVQGKDVGTWFKEHWMWITGGVVLLIIIILSMTGSSRRKSTTVVKDEFGNTKSVTRTDVVE